jgi:hypothetical protein
MTLKHFYIIRSMIQYSNGVPIRVSELDANYLIFHSFTYSTVLDKNFQLSFEAFCICTGYIQYCKLVGMQVYLFRSSEEFIIAFIYHCLFPVVIKNMSRSRL